MLKTHENESGARGKNFLAFLFADGAEKSDDIETGGIHGMAGWRSDVDYKQ
jgi:hypothetical protein